MPRYQGSNSPDIPNRIRIQLDSGGSLNFKTDNNGALVYLVTAREQQINLTILSIDRLCTLANALVAMCAETPNNTSNEPEGTRFGLLEVD